MLNRKDGNTEVMHHFGLKILFDGYLIASKFLCDGYVIGDIPYNCKSFFISYFLCDDYVIVEQALFNSHLIKQTL